MGLADAKLSLVATAEQEAQPAETPASVLPGDWPLVPLGKLCSFTNGVNADKGAYGVGTPFINVLEVINHTHLRATDIPGKVRLGNTALSSFVVRRGDIVFNRTSETENELGLAAVYVDDEAVVFGGFVIRGCFVDDSLDPMYAGYGLRAPAVRKQIIAQGQGAIRSNIGQANLSRVLVPVPPKPEQDAIAEALSDVDGLIGALEALIAKKRAIKQAAMQQLLSAKTRLPGFTAEWEDVPLGELGTFLKGAGVKRDDSGSGAIACVRYGEIYTTHHDYIRDFQSWISAEVAATATRLKVGDLLFAGSGETKEEIGKCVAFVSDIEAYAGGDIVILRPDQGNSLFLGYALNMPSVSHQKASLGQGDAVVHISAGALAQIKLSLPKPAEQEAIAKVLTDMDTEIAALEQRLQKTCAIKQGMMQQLLTGRVRLAKVERDVEQEQSGNH